MKFEFPQEKGKPLPKFGEWDVNDPASAEGFTVIFNKARNEKKTGGKIESPPMVDSKYKHEAVLGKPHSVSSNLHISYIWMYTLACIKPPSILGFEPFSISYNHYKKQEDRVWLTT